MALSEIDTIVYVMLENRSFDHMLGYLSTQAANPPMPVEGLRDDPAWLEAHRNFYEAKPYELHRLDPQQVIDDPPHEEKTIAIQITTPAGPDSTAGMGGFVESYMTRRPPPKDPGAVMGYYTQDAVPTFDFLARHYAVCDQWFAALPTGTQANRLLAMSGESQIVDNAPVFLPEQKLVYDWLTDHKVQWCAYQSGDFLPFFSLMPDWLPEIVSSLTLSDLGGRGRFRRFARFREHWTDKAAMPNVIFIEPEYTDGPHADPNDDHPPTGVAKAQAFIAELYGILISNPQRWQTTMLVVTYDEHGGFYDHVPPLPIPAEPGGVKVATTGVRVPALIVSPYVKPGSVFSGALDHTSFLQLLADRFNPGQTYSPAVAARQARLQPLSGVLSATPLAEAVPIPEATRALIAAAAAAPAPKGPISEAPGGTANARALDNAALKAQTEHPDLMASSGWRRLTEYNAGGNG